MSQEKSPNGSLAALPWVELAKVVKARKRADVPAPPAFATEDQEGGDRLAERVKAGDRLAVEEQMKAPILYAELLVKPAEDRLLLVRNDSRFRCYLLAEMLLEKSRESWFDDPKKALDATLLARELVERLDPQSYDQSLLHALKVRSLAYLANALRMNADFPAAEACFEQVEDLLEQGPLEPLEWAEVMSFRVTLYTNLRKVEEASALLDQMMAIYRTAEDLHQVGRALVQKGNLLWWANDPEGALEAMQEGIPLIEGWREPRMIALALNNLALYLNNAERPEEALEVLVQARPLLQKQGDRLNLTRMRWVEGSIYASLEKDQQAEEAFLEVSRVFRERGMDYDQGLACLDLALVYAKANRTDKIRELAGEMLSIFRSQRLGREVMAALILFQHAAEREIATLGLIQEIVSYLNRTQQMAWLHHEN
jgi:tetratricopeptide (TPR) repeat protein